MTGQTRDHTHLSFLVIQRDVGAKARYLLQCNKHLNGDNFLGGHIDEGESSLQAALRELKEEIGNAELGKRWGINIDGEVPETEWQAIEKNIKPSNGTKEDHAFQLPFYSQRMERERLAAIHFFHLQLGKDKYPAFNARLDALANARITQGEQSESFEGRALCNWFSVDELIRLGWEDRVNPFLRFALKQEIIPAALKSRTFTPYLFDAPAFEAELQSRLESLFRPLLGLYGVHALDVHVIPPAASEVSQCLSMNLALEATIEIRWSGSSDIISLNFPYPWKGVFVLPGGEKAARWKWHPWLIDRPGVHILRSGPIDNSKFIMHLAIPGKLVKSDISLEKHNISVKPAKKQSLSQFVFIQDLNCAGFHVIQSNELISWANNWVESNFDSDKAVDAQDIGYQRLNTYSAFLLDRLPQHILRQLLNISGADKKMIRKLLLADEQCGNATNNLPTKLWHHLCEIRAYLEAAIYCPDKWIKRGWLHYFDPLNGLDAIRRLTSVNRYAGNTEQLSHYPAAFRQNHPSFQGVFCPVDTPESKKVGITLHLARGVQTNAEGIQHPAVETSRDKDLGWASSMVPFYHHNDGARDMMGGKNMCQAVPLKNTIAPVVRTGHEQALKPLLKPLSDAGLLNTNASSVCDGKDLLIAYMPFKGLNFEDAIVANRDIADNGLLDWIRCEKFQCYIRPGWEPCEPDADALHPMEKIFCRAGLLFDANGLRLSDRLINSGSQLAWFRNAKNDRVVAVCYQGEEAKLTDITYEKPASPLLGGCLHYAIQQFIPLGIGDKLTGRHGNKGVISALLPPNDMPKLPNDRRLPESLRGRAVDLVLNPHGVISRMNLGQLIETHYGLLHLLNPEKPIPQEVGRAFSSANHLDDIKQAFESLSEKCPVDVYGKIVLTLPDGSQTKAPVVVGTQRIFRLRHAPVLKAQARRGGPGFRYNAITGQPVAGRRRRGGQRLGEMEVWALAAYQADQLLSGALGSKSNPERIQTGPGQSFAAIRDHLYALGVNLWDDHGKFQMDWMDEKTIRGICSEREVTSDATWQRTVTTRFCCPKCKWAIFDGKPVQGTGDPQRNESLRLTVADIFAHSGYEIVGLDSKAHPDGFHLTRPGTGSNHGKACITVIKNNRRKTVLFDIERTRSQIKLKFRFKKVKNFSAYIQWRYQAFDFMDVLPGMGITCSAPSSRPHTTNYLEPDAVTASLMPVPGGLYDPQLFGDLDLSNPELRRAYINLPQPIPYPEKLIPSPLGRPVIDEATIPPLEAVLVLPLRYRMGNAHLGNMDKLTLSYGELVRLSARGHELLQQIAEEENEASRNTLKESLGKNKRSIQATIRQLFLVIRKRLTGKLGIIRRHGLGRRVDLSGRLVIVPDPELDWNACGLPTATLIELLGSRVAEWDLLTDYMHSSSSEQLVDALIKAMNASPDSGADHDTVRNDIRDWVASPAFWEHACWPNDKLSNAHLGVAREILEGYLDAHPDIRVLLNRCPSLHRYNIMAFRPRPLAPDDGLILKINPLVCKGFAADFDGDEMAIHLPLTDEEHKEAAKLEPTAPANLVSLANGKPLAHFDQDFVLGHFLIGMDATRRKKLRERFVDHGCNDCGKILFSQGLWDKKHGEKLLAHLCEYHPDEVAELIPAWMHLCFDVVTRAGISFGFLDLDACRPEQSSLDAILNGVDCEGKEPDVERMECINKRLEAVTDDRMKVVVEDTQGVICPGFGAAAMAFSGARGKKQMRQLVSARGFLSSGDTGFDVCIKDFFCSQSLLDGLDTKSAFFTAMNTRSSMVDKKLGTAQAGFLTRRLVLRLWSWYVHPGDCGQSDKHRMLSSCKWIEQRKVCTACYGEIDGTPPPEGFPAGLIAAQSFGERGTQLSMQSFHTGTSGISLKSVEKMLTDDQLTNDAEVLLAALVGISAYMDLDARHLQLICLELSRHGALRGQPGKDTPLFTMLAGSYQWQGILKAIASDLPSDDASASPFGRLMLSKSPVGFWKED